MICSNDGDMYDVEHYHKLKIKEMLGEDRINGLCIIHKDCALIFFEDVGRVNACELPWHFD